MAEKPKGVGKEESFDKEKKTKENAYDAVYRLISEPGYSATQLHRIKTSLAPLIPEASRNSARSLLLWSRQGSPLRPLLLISVTLSLSLSLQCLWFVHFFVNEVSLLVLLFV